MSESKNDQYYKLSSIVDDFVDDIDMPRLWHKCLKWAIKGLEEINLDVSQQPKTCLLDVTPRKTVILPSGFVDWTIVAAKVGQYAVTLGTNDALTGLPRDTTSVGSAVRLLSQDAPNGLDFTLYDGFYLFNYNNRSLFSLGFGVPSKGFFRIFDNGTSKELLLDFDFSGTQIYLEYITDGFEPCGETIVDPYLKSYVEAFMSFKYEKRNNPKATGQSRIDAGRELEAAERKVRARHFGITPKELMNSDRKHFRFTPKI